MKNLLVLFLCIMSNVEAALTFGAVNSDRVVVTAATSINNLTAASSVSWIFPTSLVTGGRLWQKGLAGTSPNGAMLLNVQGTAGDIQFAAQRATSNASYVTNTTPIATLNKWYCVAATYNDGATPAMHIYVGTATTPLVEATYSTALDGSGATKGDSAVNLVVGNFASNTLAFNGRIALHAQWNRALTLGELKAQQFAPHVTSGNVVFMYLGFNGTGTQADWSGNKNNGTVTGATVSNAALFAPFSTLLHNVFPMLPAWWLP